MIINMRLLLSVFVVSFSLTACLQTRSAIRNDGPAPAPVFGTVPSAKTPSAPSHTPEQIKKAESVAQSSEIDDDFRQLYGRVEAVEGQLQAVKENEYVKGLEAKVNQLEGKLALLETTVADLNAKNRAAAEAPVAKTPASPLEEANSHFEKKKWEDAILAYEEYRKKNPKGDGYSLATYRIGLSFQEMGLKSDAKAFYKEVVDKYPKSKEAGLAKTKLKKL
jgi:TolA-binding protein